MCGKAVAAFSGADDRAAALDDLCRRRHPFDSLIEVLIERISRVRRQHEIEGRGDLPHGCSFGVGAGGAVLGEGVTIGAGNVLTRGVRVFPQTDLPDGAITF